MTHTLNEQEQETFAAAEEAVARFLDSKIRIGRALIEIKDERLHRAAGFTSFYTYCAKHFDMDQGEVRRYIRLAQGDDW